MAKFNDSEGRQWELKLDGPTIRELRTAKELGGGIDLIDEVGNAMQRLAGDPCLLVDLLWHLCGEQARHAGIDVTSFAGGLVGDSIDAASEALLEAITDFFPKRRRQLMGEIAAKQKSVEEKALAVAMGRLSNPDLEAKILSAMEANLDEQVQAALTRLQSATNSPASAESAPAA